VRDLSGQKPGNTPEIFWKVVGQARTSLRGQVLSAKLDLQQHSEDGAGLQRKVMVFENPASLGNDTTKMATDIEFAL
jgi:hypothetical protein